MIEEIPAARRFADASLRIVILGHHEPGLKEIIRDLLPRIEALPLDEYAFWIRCIGHTAVTNELRDPVYHQTPLAAHLAEEHVTLPDLSLLYRRFRLTN